MKDYFLLLNIHFTQIIDNNIEITYVKLLYIKHNKPQYCVIIKFITEEITVYLCNNQNNKSVKELFFNRLQHPIEYYINEKTNISLNVNSIWFHNMNILTLIKDYKLVQILMNKNNFIMNDKNPYYYRLHTTKRIFKIFKNQLNIYIREVMLETLNF